LLEIYIHRFTVQHSVSNNSLQFIMTISYIIISQTGRQADREGSVPEVEGGLVNLLVDSIIQHSL